MEFSQLLAMLKANFFVNCMLNVIISLPNSCTVSKFPRFCTLVRTLLVLSFQRFSIRSFACNVLILSINLLRMLICSYRLSLVFLKFLRTLVHSYGILVSSHVSLYRSTFARCYCRQINCSRCVRFICTV